MIHFSNTYYPTGARGIPQPQRLERNFIGGDTQEENEDSEKGELAKIISTLFLEFDTTLKARNILFIVIQEVCLEVRYGLLCVGSFGLV